MILWADASWLFALLDPRDQWHTAARGLLQKVRPGHPPRVHPLVLAEVVTLVGGRRGGTAARTAYDVVLELCELLLPERADLDAAATIVHHQDGRLSLSDALTAHYALTSRDAGVLSFDTDFDRTGVTRVAPE